MYDRANSYVFKDFLKSGRDGEERTAWSDHIPIGQLKLCKLKIPIILDLRQLLVCKTDLSVGGRVFGGEGGQR